MNEIDTWNGPVFKRWIDEEEFGSKHMSDFRQVDIITEKQSPTTKDEAKQLKESGESERIVHCEPKHLRQIFIRNDAVLDTHQVFIEQTSDGRENDRIHFVALKNKAQVNKFKRILLKTKWNIISPFISIF